MPDSMDSLSTAADQAEWLTLGQVAEALDLSEKTIRRRLKAGELPTELVQKEPTHTGFRYLVRRDALDTLSSRQPARVSTYAAALDSMGKSLVTRLDTLQASVEAGRQENAELRTLVEALTAQIGDTQKGLPPEPEPPAQEKPRRSWWRRLTRRTDEGSEG